MLDALGRYRARRDVHGLDLWRETVAQADDFTQLTARDEPDEPEIRA